MKPTSHTTKTKLGRKPIVGLTPDILIKQMKEAAGATRKNVRTLRKSDSTEPAVLSDSRKSGAGSSGEGGIFGAIEGAGDREPSISDAPGITGDTFRSQLSKVLKNMLGQAPPQSLVALEGLGRVATNAEALAAVIQKQALEGKQWACEFWRDMAEGKPVRAAQQNNSEVEIEDNLDRVSLANLNRLATSK